MREVSSYDVKDYCRLQWEFVYFDYDMLCTCMYNYVDNMKPPNIKAPKCTVGVKNNSRFRSFRVFFLFRFSSHFCRSIPFRSNRLPRANSFSTRHEFVCKKSYRPRPIALFIAGVRAWPRGDGSARAYLYFLRFIIECTTSLGSLLVATDSPFLLQAT